MAKYKVIYHYSDGCDEEDEEIFDNRSDAEDHGSYMCACLDEGADVLNLSDPDEYPLEEAVSVDYEIVEIED